MYRNLYIIACCCLGCLAVSWLTFNGSARGRADFVFNNATEPQTLDPGLMSGQPEGELAYGLFEGLTTPHPETLEPVPALAQSWDVDGLTYVFHLRRDAWWVKGDSIYSAGGRPRNVTASDLVYSWRRHLHPETGSEYSYLLHSIAGAEEYEKTAAAHWKKLVERYAREHPGIAVTRASALLPDDRRELEAFRDREWADRVKIRARDDGDLEVTLKTPAPYFLFITSFYALYPVLREAIEEHGDAWILPENFVTNGPFLLEDWKFNSHVRLRKNTHHWETGAYVSKRIADLQAAPARRDFEVRELALLEKLGSFVDRGMRTVDALAVEEMNTSLNLYLNGDVDRVREVPGEVTGDLIRESRRPGTAFRHLHHGSVESTYYYILNMKLPIFQKGEPGRKLRRALALCIDRQGMVEVVTRAHQMPAFRVVPGGIPGYSRSRMFGNGSFEADVEEARRLIAEVRASGVEIPRLRFTTNTHENHLKIAAFVQNVWKTQLGIDLEISNQEWGVFLDTRRTGNFEIARGAWNGDYPDPRTFLDLFTSDNQNNDPKYANPWYDRLILKYCDHILEALATPASRAAILEDLRRWPAFGATIGARVREDGKPLFRSLQEALDGYAPEQTGSLERAFAIRLLLFEAAEEMLIYDMPILPFYFYTYTELWPPELEGISFNSRVIHPLKYLRWKDGRRPEGPRKADFPTFSAYAR